MLAIRGRQVIGIKSGFTSGYPGEGPMGLSFALQALDHIFTPIDETIVSRDILDRLNASSLTRRDIDSIRLGKISGNIWLNYITEKDATDHLDHKLFRSIRQVMPYSIIDNRLMDLAISFFKDSDKALVTGYRRLEDAVRQRTGSSSHGSRLFSDIFHPDSGKLTWKDIDASEAAGRMQMFCGVFMTFRNPRAHKESAAYRRDHLSEFLVLNALYHLESTAIENEAQQSVEGTAPTADVGRDHERASVKERFCFQP